MTAGKPEERVHRLDIVVVPFENIQPDKVGDTQRRLYQPIDQPRRVSVLGIGHVTQVDDLVGVTYLRLLTQPRPQAPSIFVTWPIREMGVTYQDRCHSPSPLSCPRYRARRDNTPLSRARNPRHDPARCTSPATRAGWHPRHRSPGHRAPVPR